MSMSEKQEAERRERNRLMKDAYMKKGATIKDVAKEFGVNKDTVRNNVYALMSDREIEAKKFEIRRAHATRAMNRAYENTIGAEMVRNRLVQERHVSRETIVGPIHVPSRKSGRMSSPVPGESLLKFIVEE